MGNSIPCTCNFEVVQCLKMFELDKTICFCLRPRRDGENLRQEMEDLRQMKDVVNQMVSYQQRIQPRTECKLEVRIWMQKVEELNTEVTRLLNSLEQRSCSFPCNYKLGKEVSRMLKRVRTLAIEKKDFPDSLINPIVIEDVPYPVPTFYCDREETLSEILHHLKDDTVKMVGIYGMGGVGKTTILKKIQKKPNDWMHVFELVVWITVSKVVDVTDIQKQIAKQLKITPTSDQRGIEEEEERARTLRTALMDKKLLLLMDDIWDFLDLQKIGIPMPTIDCDTIKIAFTTRDEQVCINMASQERVKVEPMNEEDSLKLFGKNLDSEEILKDVSFLSYAKKIVKKCDGLPLAIITIARVMAKCRMLHEWQDMFERL